jgi:2-octaprenyl-6-methoxyphenol hydroxylase
VGGSLAIALGESGLRVALVEAVPAASDQQPSFDARSIALSHGSCRILTQLGVWAHLQEAVWPVREIHVSEQGRFGTTLIDAAEQGIEQLGHVIQAHALGEALWARIRECSSLTVFCPARVTTTVAPRGGQRQLSLTTADGTAQTLNTRLLAIADGARSPLRQAVGITASERDYAQVAVICGVQVAPRYAGHRAFERFTPTGPLAVLPGPDGRYTAVLARPAERATALLAETDAEYLARLQRLCGWRLGRLQRIGPRVSYPLALTTAASLTAPRAVLIGNAANSLHPVAGQGFNLGLRDVASLAELLVAAGRAAGDPGSPALLDQYAEWRSADQRAVVRFTDSLIRVFGVRATGLAAARGLALSLFDLSVTGKRALARQTMGLAGRMTRLGRGLPL